MGEPLQRDKDIYENDHHLKIAITKSKLKLHSF